MHVTEFHRHLSSSCLVNLIDTDFAMSSWRLFCSTFGQLKLKVRAGADLRWDTLFSRPLSLRTPDTGHRMRRMGPGQPGHSHQLLATQTVCLTLSLVRCHHPGLPGQPLVTSGHSHIAGQIRGYGTIGRRRDFEIDPFRNRRQQANERRIIVLLYV